MRKYIFSIYYIHIGNEKTQINGRIGEMALRNSIVNDVKTLRGSETFKISVDALRFFEHNQREDFGLNPEKQSQIVQIIFDKYTVGFTTEEKNLIKENLIDPELESEVRNSSYFDSMSWLVNNIIEFGQNDPIRGYWNNDTSEFVVTDGNRRTMALIIANKVLDANIVYALVLQENMKPTDNDHLQSYLERQLISNQGSKKMSPWEQAKIVKLLQEQNVSDDKLVSLLGSKAILADRRKLLALPEELLQEVKNGSVTPTVAVEIYKEEVIKESVPVEVVVDSIKEATDQVKKDKAAGKTTAKKTSKSAIKSTLRQKKNSVPTEQLTRKPKETNAELIKEINRVLGNIMSSVNNGDLFQVTNENLEVIKDSLSQIMSTINKSQ